MKLVTYQKEAQVCLGLLSEDRILNLTLAAPVLTGEPLPATMIGLLELGATGLDRVRQIGQMPASASFSDPLAQVTLLPPVLRPQKVVCLGRNYAAHAAEGGAKVPDYPMLFHKTAGSLLGNGGTIIIPSITEKVDYEGELAVIIGQTCKDVAPEEALDYVAGYTIANDVTARDLQRRTSQFTAGKMPDTFCPLGPALVTADEIADPQNLAIRTVLNGQVMQDDNTRNMIFDIPFTISYISRIATLCVGDVVLTGTPQGVGYARIPPVFLKAGDQILKRWAN